VKRARLIRPRMRLRRRTMVRDGGLRAAWKGIALTWRKNLRAFARGAQPAGRGAIRQTWRPHFHFYINVAPITVRPAPRGVPPARTATAVLWRRIDTRLSSLLPVVRDVSTREWRSHVRRVERDIVTRPGARSATGWREIARLFRTSGLPARRIEGRVSAGITAPGSGRLGIASVPMVITPRRQRRTFAPVRPEARAPRLVLRSTPPATSAARAERAAPPPFRAPDLVWRVETEGRSIEAAERLVRAAAVSMPAMPPPNEHVSWPSPEAAAALRPRPIDPALIDRVAEDVIGRVEKRIRIERERRGV
jgi:hypothetical protein